MKNDSLGISFKNETEEKVADILKEIILEVRKEISKEYDIYKGVYKDYNGLCDVATRLLERKINTYAMTNEIEIKFNSIHGEQKHTSALKSYYWPFQHTWASVSMMGITMYVDPTSSQFKRFYNYIPDFYISTSEPKWYYPDSKNPLYSNKIAILLNDHIHIPRKVIIDGKVHRYREGIIEYFQYHIWGMICDDINCQEKDVRRQLWDDDFIR